MSRRGFEPASTSPGTWATANRAARTTGRGRRSVVKVALDAEPIVVEVTEDRGGLGRLMGAQLLLVQGSPPGAGDDRSEPGDVAPVARVERLQHGVIDVEPRALARVRDDRVAGDRPVQDLVGVQEDRQRVP